jgi:hypothetical protein
VGVCTLSWGGGFSGVCSALGLFEFDLLMPDDYPQSPPLLNFKVSGMVPPFVLLCGGGG